MKPKNNHGIKRIIRATGFSLNGLTLAYRNEAAFRQELVLMAIALPLVLWLDVTYVERILLILGLFIVLIVELLNSAIEAVVDRVGEEIHPLSGQAKDIASAAVMLSLILCATIWCLILAPRLFNFF
ncbi:diacylglycerol kinase [Shewanella denitrificans OS217]|uniref:Diacylglycerol kinase n=1 Tax=Shewanella denitrificans (strain OS217 / ATCC BAA-1090 / DSM 15013) TaxID=318161 RepID=Q12LT8_SHEDO|nr:diacylglycerol kinase [Shewanella denitrificans]ABE55588.1 diacylglycerol kinase [Shewanella denitrificans OS217]